MNDFNYKLILENIIKLCSLAVQLDINLINDKHIKTFLNSLQSDLKDEKLLHIFGNSLQTELSLLFPHLLLHEQVSHLITTCLNSISFEELQLKSKCSESDLVRQVIERPELFWLIINEFSDILMKCSHHSVIGDIAHNFRLVIESNITRSQTIFDYYPNCLHSSVVLLRLFEQIDLIESGFNAKKFQIIQELCLLSKELPKNYFAQLLLIFPSVAKYIYRHKSCIDQNYF